MTRVEFVAPDRDLLILTGRRHGIAEAPPWRDIALIEMHDGVFGFATPGSQEAAKKPRRCQVGIEENSSVEQCDADIEISCEMGERMTASRERDRVVSAQLDRTARQSCAVGCFLLAVDRPAVDFAPEVAPCGHCVSRSELGIEIDTFMKQVYAAA